MLCHVLIPGILVHFLIIVIKYLTKTIWIYSVFVVCEFIFFLTLSLVTYNRRPNWLIGLLDTILWSLNGVDRHPQGRLTQCDIRELK